MWDIYKIIKNVNKWQRNNNTEKLGNNVKQLELSKHIKRLLIII